MGRAPCCDKANVKRGPWSPEEDAALRNYLHKNGTAGNWISLPRKAGLKRCGKSCRLRWLNYLRPDIRHGGFTEEEDNIICTLYNSIGSRWSVIASQLPGRTDNDVKNYWNTKLKKKLLAGKVGPNDITTKNTSHLNPAQISTSVPKVETCYDYGNSAYLNANSGALPYEMNMNRQQNFDSQGQILNTSDQFLLPVEVLDYNILSTANNNYSNTMPSSEEISSLSTSTSQALENTNFSWSGKESVEEDQVLLEFGFESPYLELLNGIGFQQKL